MSKAFDFDAVIFDGDGVIFDSEKLSTLAFLRTMEGYGLTFTEKDAEPWIGISTTVMLESLRKTHGFSIPFDEYVAQRDVVYEACCRDIDGPRKLPGIDALLLWLEAESIPFAIASSASPRKLSFNLERTGLTARFAVTVNNAMVKRGKPAPDIFEEAARRLGVDIRRCIVVEDSLAGLKGAVAAGAIPVAVEGSHEREKLQELAVAVYATPAELLEDLRGTRVRA